MRQYKLGLILLMGLALVTAGCMKKSTNQANSQGTGFETATMEDLAQLPQANNSANSNQQGGIEVLPIETAPVTQGVSAPDLAATSSTSNTSVAVSTEMLNHEQHIQTALKNAGFYTGKIDGKIGPGTKKAIEAFQQSKSLKVDGKVGPKTWAALEPYLNAGESASTAAAASAATTD